jgi:tRNA pseudouridine38-40 synthase
VYDRWCERSRGKPQHPRDLQLDVAAMQEAAGHLVGMHDFSTFQDSRRPSGNAAKGVTCRHLARRLLVPAIASNDSAVHCVPSLHDTAVRVDARSLA